MSKPSVLVLAAAALLTGCGAASPDRPNRDATLVLNSTPNAVHAGIYMALARDYTGAEGVQLRVEAPPPGADPAKRLATSRAQLAILDIHDLARAREAGRDLVGVMAIVERPLTEGRLGVERPRDRHGKRVSVAAAPAYPELVLAVARTTLEDDPALARATVAALQRGYREALADPESAVQALLDRTEGLERDTIAAQLDAIQPAFQAPDGTIGTLDRARLEAWARWEAKAGITRRAPDVALAFEPRFARAGAKLAAETSGT